MPTISPAEWSRQLSTTWFLCLFVRSQKTEILTRSCSPGTHPCSRHIPLAKIATVPDKYSASASLYTINRPSSSTARDPNTIASTMPRRSATAWLAQLRRTLLNDVAHMSSFCSRHLHDFILLPPQSTHPSARTPHITNPRRPGIALCPPTRANLCTTRAMQNQPGTPPDGGGAHCGVAIHSLACGNPRHPSGTRS